MIHAGIDGYSRLPHCSSNNEAQTVLPLFLSAVLSVKFQYLCFGVYIDNLVFRELPTKYVKLTC